MKDIIVETKPFREMISKASSDCWKKSNNEVNTMTYGITLDRIIEIAFDFLIETLGSWSCMDPEKLLRKKLYTKGFKKLPRYKTEKELYNKACNFDDKAISGSEKKVLTALLGLSANYRWDLYLALSEFIDGFLF